MINKESNKLTKKSQEKTFVNTLLFVFESSLTFVAFICLLGIILRSGYEITYILSQIINLFNYIAIFIYSITLFLNILLRTQQLKDIRYYIIDFVVFIPLMLSLENIDLTANLIVLRQVLVLGKAAFNKIQSSNQKNFGNWQPAKIIVLSFLILILVGSICLTLPISRADGEHSTHFVDALFTATSATCVTGLIVVDTGSHYSFVGQIIIIILVQIGGLGMMTLTTGLGLFIGRALHIREKKLMKDLLFQIDSEDFKKLLLHIVKITFTIELIGAVILSAAFYPDRANLFETVYHGIFHAISGFCNAGFCLYSDSLIRYVDHFWVNITISTLIIFGSLGFTVISNVLSIINTKWNKKHKNVNIEDFRRTYLTVHSKVVIFTTLSIFLFGTVLTLFLEYNTLLEDMDIGTKIMASWFQTVADRTAGFSTVDFSYPNATNANYLFTMLLMFIGGSPASVGGGIKTTTLFILLVTARAYVLGREVTAFKRRISNQIILQAFGVISLSFITVFVFVLILSITEELNLICIAFEVVSAFATVGLSTGITSDLSDIGKLLITFLMFIGRVGPLSFALAVGVTIQKTQTKLPEANIMIG